MRKNFPTSVTRGSFFFVQPFCSSSSVCTYMVRNLYILNGLLCSPTLSCAKISGPFDVALTRIADSSITGEKRMIHTIDPTTSIQRFTNALNVLDSGT